LLKSDKDYGGPFSSKVLSIRSDRVPFVGSTEWDYYYRTYQWGINAIGTVSHPSLDNLIWDGSEARNEMFSNISYPEDLASFSNKVYGRLNPTEDLPDILEIIGELLLDGIPKLPGKLFSRLRNFKSLGSEYLNVKFGWEPFIRDVISLLELWLELDERITQLLRDNGQKVRRSGVLFSETTSTPLVETADVIIDVKNVSIGGYYPLVDVEPQLSAHRGRTWSVTKDEVWFSGRGSYLLPTDLQFSPTRDNVLDYITLLAEVPDISSVYEVIPWTWLIDWFTNIGEIVARAAGHGIGEYTLDYCYLMRHRTIEQHYAVQYYKRRSNITDASATDYVIPCQKRDASATVSIETKQRIAASPFGFEVSLDGLTPRQIAILTALGLSRQNFI
jgi:hypothetical protein